MMTPSLAFLKKKKKDVIIHDPKTPFPQIYPIIALM